MVHAEQFRLRTNSDAGGDCHDYIGFQLHISSTSFSILVETILCSCKALEGSGVVVSFEIFSVKQSTSSFILLFSSVEGVNRDGIKLNDGLHNGVVISPSLEIPGGQFSSSIRK